MSLRQDLIEAGADALVAHHLGRNILVMSSDRIAADVLDAMLDLLTTSEWPSQYTRDLLAVLRNPGSRT